MMGQQAKGNGVAFCEAITNLRLGEQAGKNGFRFDSRNATIFERQTDQAQRITDIPIKKKPVRAIIEPKIHRH